MGAENAPPSGQSSGALVMRYMFFRSPPGFQGFKDNNILMYKVYIQLLAYFYYPANSL